jgi:transcriptional regulator with PAS, ATPase and Fis domain
MSEEEEKKIIITALKMNNYNQTRVAKSLGIDRKTLRNKIRKYGL